MKFTVWGKPKAKGRPRLSTYGGFARAYTPQDTIEYENLIKLSYLQASETQEAIDYEKPIVMTINGYYPISKNTSKKKKLEMINGRIRPCIKVDCDNLAKIIADSLNAVAYKDDTQIVDMYIHKWYDEQPRVEVEITNYGND